MRCPWLCRLAIRAVVAGSDFFVGWSRRGDLRALCLGDDLVGDASLREDNNVVEAAATEDDDDDDDDEDEVGIPGAEGESLKAAPSPSALRSAEEDDVAAGVATPPLFKAGSFPRRIIASTSS